MEKELLKKLQKITPEEKEFLKGATNVRADLYTSDAVAPTESFTIDSRHLLEKGRLIDVRPHTRFVHFPRHSHNYVEMVYMCSGTTTHILNGTERLVLEEGDLLFLSEFTTQEILPAGKNDIAVNFIILPEFFNRTLYMIEQENILRDFILSILSGKSPEHNYLYFRAREILPVQNLLENMIWTVFRENPRCNTVNQTTMGLILMNLSLFSSEINRTGSNRFEQDQVFSVLKYIDQNYRTGTLEEISAELSQPTYTVSRLLKKHTGHNFKELLQEKKLQQAAYLLTDTTLTGEAVLSSIGYDNSSYFYRKFKEKYGCSPKQYREGSPI